MEKEMFIKNRKGLNMSIKLNISEERNKLVFLEHGLSARKEYPHMKIMEELFAKFGYNVINIDATNSINASEISGGGITFSGHYEDLEDVILWAKSQDLYLEPFALGGHSLGAASCVWYSCKNPQNVNLLLVASCPFISGKELVANDPMMQEIDKNGFFLKQSRSTGKVFRINSIFNEDVKNYNFTKQIKNITARTYVIQGLLDLKYIQNNSGAIYDLLKCDKKLILLENTPHDLANTEETKELFTKTMVDILNEVDKNL